jgi:hypothetical protein
MLSVSTLFKVSLVDLVGLGAPATKAKKEIVEMKNIISIPTNNAIASAYKITICQAFYN